MGLRTRPRSVPSDDESLPTSAPATPGPVDCVESCTRHGWFLALPRSRGLVRARAEAQDVSLVVPNRKADRLEGALAPKSERVYWREPLAGGGVEPDQTVQRQPTDQEEAIAQREEPLTRRSSVPAAQDGAAAESAFSGKSVASSGWREAYSVGPSPPSCTDST